MQDWGRGNKGEKKMGHCNSIINKIYLKNTAVKNVYFYTFYKSIYHVNILLGPLPGPWKGLVQMNVPEIFLALQ